MEDIIMNINKAICGITALALCLALAGCPAVDEEDGAAKLNVPGMEPVSNLQDFPDTIRSVGLITEATTLFNNATTVLTAKTGVTNNLWTQDTAVYYGEDGPFYPVSKIHDYSLKNDKTISVNFEGEEGVDLENLANPINSTSGTAGKIYGSNTATATVNGPTSLGNYYGADFRNRVDGVTQDVKPQGLVKKNESVTEKFSGNRTFVITEGFYGSGTVASPYVAGYVTVDYSGATKKTQTDDKEKHDIYTESSNDDIKFSITIVAYTTGTTGTGAKFRLSGIQKGSSATTRSVSSGGATTISNLEVYTNNGSKIHDLPPDQFGVNSAVWFTFAKDIVARSLFNKFNP